MDNSGNIVGVTTIEIGQTTCAAAGDIRLDDDGAIYAWTTASPYYHRLIASNAADKVLVGDTAYTSAIDRDAAGDTRVLRAGNDRLTVSLTAGMRSRNTIPVRISESWTSQPLMNSSDMPR